MLLALFFRLFICNRINPHTRDWTLWDAMGLSKCTHCRRRMTKPSVERRNRL